MYLQCAWCVRVPRGAQKAKVQPFAVLTPCHTLKSDENSLLYLADRICWKLEKCHIRRIIENSKISEPLFFRDVQIFDRDPKKRSVTWKWVCLGRFLDGFQNLAINQEKSFSFWIEYKWHRIQHYSVPVGNSLFFSCNLFCCQIRQTLCISREQVNKYLTFKGNL